MPVVAAAGALLLGAAVGAAAGELLKAILEVKDKISNCKEEMEQLEVTLKNIIPLFQEGQRLEARVMEHLGSDRVRSDPDLMIQRLEEGTVLVRKSATIRFWTCGKKYSYAKKVLDLNSFLSFYCQREILVEMFRDIKQLLVNVTENNGNLDAVTSGSAGAVPGLGESTVETVVTDGVSARDLAEMAPESARTPLGAAARELQQCIKDRTRNGKNHLEQLDRTLQNVIPCIDEDKQFDGNVMDRRRLEMDQLIAQLEKSKVLVEKSTMTRPPNFHKLNDELLSFYQHDMQAEIWRYNKQIMEEMKEAQMRLNVRNRAVNDALLADVGSTSASAVPELSTSNDGSSTSVVPELPTPTLGNGYTSLVPELSTGNAGNRSTSGIPENHTLTAGNSSTSAIPNLPTGNVGNSSTSGIPKLPTLTAGNSSTSAIPKLPNGYVRNSFTSAASEPPTLTVGDSFASDVPELPTRDVGNSSTSDAPELPTRDVGNSSTSDVPMLPTPSDGNSSTSNVPELPTGYAGNSSTFVVSELPTLTDGNSSTSVVPALPTGNDGNSSTSAVPELPILTVGNGSTSTIPELPTGDDGNGSTSDFPELPTLAVRNSSASANPELPTGDAGNSFTSIVPELPTDDDGRSSTSDVPQRPSLSVGNGSASVVSQHSTLTIGNSYASLVPPLPALTVGMAVPLNELKTKLFQDGVNVTGLCAPAGGGKTTLAAALCMDGEVKDKFKENIYFMPVSSSPNLKVIVQVLLKNMVGLCCMPEFQNEEYGLKGLGYLLKLMEPQPILVVLDDVWSKEIIQKFKFGTTGYKLLITTRIDFECFDYTYHLKMFGKKDAQILFRYWAFPEEGDYEEPDETQVNEIAKGCKGFPMLLKVIGNSLRQQPQRKWQRVATMLSGGSSILRAHPELLDCLSPSLDSMEPQLQECFLDLGSFPKDILIPAAALIDMWIELYNLDENGAYGNLLELSLRNLVNLIGSGSIRKDAGDPYFDFNELFVTQHVLFRDLALYRIQEINIRQNKRLLMDRREEALPKIWEELNNQMFEARVVSIDTGEIDTSSWFEMGFPNAKVLILNFSGKTYCLPPFLKQMEKLKVLIIKNNGLKQAKLSGFPPVACLPNLRRIRLEMISIPSLDKSMDPLKNLQKLSLVLCEVGEVMRNCTVDYSVIFPNLSEIDIGYCNDLLALPLGFWKLDLHKLIISHCFKLNQLSENIDQMKEIETLRLRACFGLEELPDQICSLEKLQFLDISESFRIGKIPEDLSKLRSLRKLDMRKCIGLRQIPKSAMELKNLKEVVCDEERATLWEPVRHHLPRLRIKVREEINLDWLGFFLE